MLIFCIVSFFFRFRFWKMTATVEIMYRLFRQTNYSVPSCSHFGLTSYKYRAPQIVPRKLKRYCFTNICSHVVTREHVYRSPWHCFCCHHVIEITASLPWNMMFQGYEAVFSYQRVSGWDKQVIIALFMYGENIPKWISNVRLQSHKSHQMGDHMTSNIAEFLHP